MPSTTKNSTPLKIEQGISLASFSTFGIGGPAAYFAEARSIEEFQELLKWATAKKLPFLIIGKGSNSLFDDRGFGGLVIVNKLLFVEERSLTEWHVGSGYSFSLLGIQTAKKGLSGLEFACGIPGSVGGAVFMNAGAGGKEVCETLTEVTFLDKEAKLHTFKREALSFSYRHSSFHETQGVIVSAVFKFQIASEARAKQIEMIAYRTQTQPYGDKSCGCVFRNPPKEASSTLSAGALIEACGLKGVRRGGAEVSMLHANFIVNRDKATAQDVLDLAEFVRSEVKKCKGIALEFELRKLPYA